MQTDLTGLRATPDGVSLEVLASAGAAQSKVRGWHGGALKLSVRAAPEHGRANSEIEELLAGFFGVRRKQVAVVSGLASRRKRVLVGGIDLGSARARVHQLHAGVADPNLLGSGG